MKIERRGVLKAFFGTSLGIGLAALAAVAGLWTVMIARFLHPNVSQRSRNVFDAGSPTDYPEGSVETRFRQIHGVWVVRGTYRGRSQIYALRAACTHLGCVTLWQESLQKFQCPCHGSGFSKDGINVEGPAPRPMERCAIRLTDDGRLEVDRGRTFCQERGEWDDPESFVEG